MSLGRRSAVLAILLGAAVGAGVVVTLGFPTLIAHAEGPNVTAPSVTQGGRFQIIFNPSGVRADTFLLDTQTGRIWRPTKFTDLEGEPSAWVYEDRLDTQAGFNVWAAGYKSKTGQ